MRDRLLPIVFAVLYVLVSLSCGKAAATSGGRQPPIRICVDPGHPSEVGRGTSGKHITEMAVNWLVAKRLRDILTAKGVAVTMTKTREGQFVANRARAETANAAHADLMVRLHCDGGNGIGSGFAVYYPDHPGRIGPAVGPSAQVIAASRAAGQAFYRTLSQDLQGELPARGLHPDTATRVGSLHGALIGSIFSKVPVVLVEMCVLTNPKDEAWMRSDDGQRKMAEALADAAITAIRSLR